MIQFNRAGLYIYSDVLSERDDIILKGQQENIFISDFSHCHSVITVTVTFSFQPVSGDGYLSITKWFLSTS